jgi:integrative and conjugative element protein (TIGR02256 family)
MRQPITPVPVVRFSRSSIESIAREVIAGGAELETGGILLGYEQEGLTVTRAGGPGPKAVRGPRFFLRDLEHAQRMADDAWPETGSQWIGDWHTHPDGAIHPSPVDLRAVADVLRDAELRLNSFLAVVVAPLPDTGWSLHAWEASLRAERLEVRPLNVDLSDVDT